MDAPTLFQIASAPRVTLEKESNIGNVNGLIGPFSGLDDLGRRASGMDRAKRFWRRSF